jgi:hypothetical protein
MARQVPEPRRLHRSNYRKGAGEVGTRRPWSSEFSVCLDDSCFGVVFEVLVLESFVKTLGGAE